MFKNSLYKATAIGLFTLLTSTFGMTAYAWQCPNCSSEASENFCSQCGTPNPENAASSGTSNAAFDEVLQSLKDVILRIQSGDQSAYDSDTMGVLLPRIKSLDEIGYNFTDLDQDGKDELIVGKTQNAEFNPGSIIYIYNNYDGEAEMVVASGERYWYTVCTNGAIHYFGSGSAFTASDVFYSLDDGMLDIIESVFYDSQEDENNPYYYSTTSDDVYDVASRSPISESEARSIINSYETMELSFQPFTTLP